ncbi:MAG: Integral membrane protein MviN [Parcubacteria group bacterium Gr01-1014_29]|nr:MAG: Integral membrane protein MviN [Parcubacteria group bacterium Gr01-1014_29]
MVRRIFELFHKEFRKVQEAAFLLAVATIASNILGIVRDRLLASRFGAGEELDIYYAAFRVPDILYTLSLFFVASTAIIPLFLERIAQNEERAREFTQTILVAFLLGITVLIGAAYVAMPAIMPFLVPGFDPAMHAEAVQLSRVMLLSPLLLGLSNLASSILQSFRRFFPYAASFLFYNLGIIVGIVFFVPHIGLSGLAWGVVFGALLHVGIQIPSLVHTGYFPRLALQRRALLMEVFRRSLPRTLGLVAMQCAFLAVTAIASLLGVGSIAIFQLAYNLQSIPLAVIGLSYSVAAFPTMTELIVKKERSLFFDHLFSASRHILFWTLPSAVLFIVLRAQIVRVVLGAGAFSWVDTRLTAASLALFALGIVAQSLSALFVRAFYAIGNVRVPVVVNILSAGFTVVCAVVFVGILREAEGLTYVFVRMLRVADVPNVAVLGLVLAFAVGAIANAVVLGLSLGWIEGETHSRNLRTSVVDITGASILLGVVSYGVLQMLALVFDLTSFFGIFAQGLLAGLAGIIVAAVFLHARQNKEYGEIRNSMSRRFWRKETIGPEQEHL